MKYLIFCPNNLIPILILHLLAPHPRLAPHLNHTIVLGLIHLTPLTHPHSLILILNHKPTNFLIHFHRLKNSPKFILGPIHMPMNYLAINYPSLINIQAIILVVIINLHPLRLSQARNLLSLVKSPIINHPIGIGTANCLLLVVAINYFNRILLRINYLTLTLKLATTGTDIENRQCRQLNDH